MASAVLSLDSDAKRNLIDAHNPNPLFGILLD